MSFSTRNYWQHGKTVLREQGLGALTQLIKRRINRLFGRYYFGYFDFGYTRWRKQQSSTPLGTPTITPLISVVVPVYNVDAKWLEQTLDSVMSQSYTHWQLCLVNDASTAPHIRAVLDHYAAEDTRITVKHLEDNLGIALASNQGLEITNGEWVALLDHDDLLAKDALLKIVLAIEANPEADLLYSDEDKIDTEGRFSSPFFKPDFSPELLACQNYISHLSVFRKTLIDQIGGFREGFDGAQDYDLILRASARARQVVHIPCVLYHWRQIPGSTALLFGEKDYAWEAGRLALQDYLDQRYPGSKAEKGSIPGAYKPVFAITASPLVSIIIPFRDKPELLDRCLSSLLAHTSWQPLEIIAVDNQSTNAEIGALKQQWLQKDERIRFIDYDQAFNFSAICNAGVASANGEYIVLLNNDIEITSPNWVEHLLQYAQQPAIGAVGARLDYPDGRVQHAGIVVGIGGGAGHPFKYFSKEHIGYFGRLKIASNVSAVTAALLMAKKSKYLGVGGLDENQFAIAFNDVDFCLTLLTAGYRNVFTPYCYGVHYESASRGYEESAKQKARFLSEQQAFTSKWSTFLANGDPLYNPNLALDSEDYRLKA